MDELALHAVFAPPLEEKLTNLSARSTSSGSSLFARTLDVLKCALSTKLTLSLRKKNDTLWSSFQMKEEMAKAFEKTCDHYPYYPHAA